jgi:hypothetical protein
MMLLDSSLSSIAQEYISFGTGFLRRTKLSKGKIEKQVVDDLYCTGDVKREIDEPRTGEEKARQQRTNRCTCRARYSRESSGSRSLSLDVSKGINERGFGTRMPQSLRGSFSKS